ncbi:MAG: 4-hydroxy-3-methylbut-2-enyl diphosphate reductase [Candidatus Zophobacter franzmannii]|nr:4-hydroxy-3-methylbut-2-enyl diphosphate reductase [Candidatus Zophobacter franzmannii]
MAIQILLARHAGFCFGVKRAVKIATQSSALHKEVNTLGQIIHNPQVVEDLISKGVKPINNLDECGDNPIIIRSHGVPFETYNKLEQLGNEIIDATCPFVLRAQDKVAKADKMGYQVYIYGDADHPEVLSLNSFAINKPAIVFSTPNELKGKPVSRSAVISQTTKDLAGFKAVVCRMVEDCPELLVFNTICTATAIRQRHTVELAQEVDLMLIIGGKNSSNTKMLAKLSSEHAETYHIETADEMKKEWFAKKEKIGISAGASTPDNIIVAIYNRIIDWFGGLTKAVNVADIPVH